MLYIKIITITFKDIPQLLLNLNHTRWTKT